MRLLAADLSGSRSADEGTGRLRDHYGFEQLREWVREYSATLAEAHPARDAEDARARGRGEGGAAGVRASGAGG